MIGGGFRQELERWRSKQWAIRPNAFELPARPKTQGEMKQFEISARGLTIGQVQQITEEEVRNTPPDYIAEYKRSYLNLERYGYTKVGFDTFLRHERSEKAMLATGVPAEFVHNIAERVYPVGADIYAAYEEPSGRNWRETVERFKGLSGGI